MNETALKPRARWKQPLWGCGIGCGALVLIVIVGSIGLYFWAVNPGSQIPTQRVLGPESLGFLRIDRISHDEGFQALATDFLLELQDHELQRSGRELPFVLGWLQQVQRSTPQEVVADLKRDLPTDITVSVEFSPETGRPAVAAAVNLSRYPRLFRVIYYWGKEYVASNLDGDLEGLEDASLEFVENTAIWAQDKETLRIVLERARKPGLTASGSTRIMDLLASGDERWDVYLAVEDREGLMELISTLVADRPEEFPLELPEGFADLIRSLETFWLGVDVVSRELVLVESEATARSEEAARRWKEALENVVALNQPSAETPLRIEPDLQVTGRQVSLRLEFLELKAALIKIVREAQADSQRRRQNRERERPDDGDR